MKFKKFSPLFLLLGVAAGANPTLLSSSELGSLLDVYRRNLEIQRIWEQQDLMRQQYPGIENGFDMLGGNHPELDQYLRLESKITQNRTFNEDLLKKLLTGNSTLSGLKQPMSVISEFTDPWREQEETLRILHLEHFPIVNGKPKNSFAMESEAAKSYELEIANLIQTLDKVNEGDEHTRTLKARMYCDGDFQIKTGLSRKKYDSDDTAIFTLNHREENAARTRFFPSRELQECELFFREEGSKKEYGAILTRKSDPNSDLHRQVETCFLPNPQGLPGPEKFFLSADFSSMTCPASVDHITTLEDPIEGIRSKAEALLGQPIPQEMLDTQDPYYPLDFSKTPAFENIYVSYLVFRADFGGALIARLLAHHAEKGAQVRILTSEVITLKKDRSLLAKLVSEYPNVKLQLFEYHSSLGASILDHADVLHRAMHVKLLIGINRKSPEKNFAFFGGRNIHDGFVFKKIPDLSKYPELIQYGKGGDENFVHWRDFEVKITGPAFVERIAAHYVNLWDRDSETNLVRSINQDVVVPQPADLSYFKSEKPLVRHMMSLPYKDRHLLEDYYAGLLDSAEKTIRISTPYFRPAGKIMDALERAVKRGIKITLITRLALKGDTFGWFLGDVNKDGVNQFLDQFEIFEYKEKEDPGIILHSKIVLVDDKIAFLGSVNLNKRSFLHDTENGILVYSSEFLERMNKIYDVYKEDSLPIDKEQKVHLFSRILLKIVDDKF